MNATARTATHADSSSHRAATETHTDPERAPFAERFGRALPREMYSAAHGLGWRELIDRFAPASGHLHLADLVATPLGRGRTRYEATLSLHGRAHRLAVESHGPIAAMSEMLASLGTRLETERFHQYEADGTWCTVLRAHDGRQTHWAMGFGADSGESGAAALLSAARLAA